MLIFVNSLNSGTFFLNKIFNFSSIKRMIFKSNRFPALSFLFASLWCLARAPSPMSGSYHLSCVCASFYSEISASYPSPYSLHYPALNPAPHFTLPAPLVPLPLYDITLPSEPGCFKGVALHRLIIFQRMTPHSLVLGQHKLICTGLKRGKEKTWSWVGREARVDLG